MKISEINANQGDIDIEAEVTSIDEPRSFNKFGKDLKVANAKIKDDSGEIALTLWNEDIGKVKVGNKIKITKGYAKEFNNEKQVTTGKFGTLEVLGADSSSAAPEEATQEIASEVPESIAPKKSEDETPESDLL